MCGRRFVRVYAVIFELCIYCLFPKFNCISVIISRSLYTIWILLRILNAGIGFKSYFCSCLCDIQRRHWRSASSIVSITYRNPCCTYTLRRIYFVTVYCVHFNEPISLCLPCVRISHVHVRTLEMNCCRYGLLGLMLYAALERYCL